MTTKKERIQAVLAGDRADRLPVAFWRHWPGDDQDGKRLAEVTIAYHRRYDWDFAKITPSASYAAEAWGARTSYAGTLPIGERGYVDRPVESRRDWLAIEPQDATRGALGQQITAVRVARAALGADVPLLMTVFNPLGVAKNLTGEDRFLAHVRLYGREVHAALKAIADTYQRFVGAVLRAGADGIFFATAAAAHSVMSDAEYREFGAPYDLQVLEAAADGWLTVLHLHSPYPMIQLAREYPVQAVNWDDRTSEPSLAEGQRMTGKAVFGGISQWGTLLRGTPSDVEAEAREAMAACRVRGMLLSAGCTYPPLVPEGNLLAARRVVETHD